MKTNNKTSTVRSILYIMSPSYSGSTLLTFLLSRHRDIATIGELKASALGDISKYNCSCGELISNCPFWKELQSRMLDLGSTFSLDNFGTHFRSTSAALDRFLRATVRDKLFESIRSGLISVAPTWRSEWMTIIEKNALLIDNVCDMQKGGIFLDGSKDPNRLLLMNKSGRWNIKTVFLIRDGRGVTNSYMKHVGVTMETAAKEWSSKCSEMENAVTHFDDKDILRIRYEDLCENVNDELMKIFEFAGVDVADTYEATPDIKNHVLGNAMRLNSLDEIRLDEKWKRMLTQDDLDYFYSKCGELNSKYGYSR